MTEPKIDSQQSFPNWIMPWPAFDVDWSKVGLLIIDFQNYGSNPECGVMQMIAERYPDVAEYYVPRICEVAVPNARRLLDLFRKTKREVVYTRHGALLRDGRDMILRRRQRDADSVSQTDRPTLWSRGSLEHQVVTELAPLDDELVIDKNASSPFNGTGIDQLLRNLGLETLVIVGMATDMCVETTARDAADRGYNVIVVEDATATFFPSHHANALSAFARVYGQVWNTEQVIQQLSDVR